MGYSPWGHKESDTTEHSPSHTVKLMGIKTCTEEHGLISSFKDVCKSFERLYVLQKSTLLTQIVSWKIRALQGFPPTTAFISLVVFLKYCFEHRLS